MYLSLGGALGRKNYERLVNSALLKLIVRWGKLILSNEPDEAEMLTNNSNRKNTKSFLTANKY
jgi:hypothetical protein